MLTAKMAELKGTTVGTERSVVGDCVRRPGDAQGQCPQQCSLLLVWDAG